MTGLTMFFWIVAAIITAYALIKWWERATARAAEATKEVEETRKWEADRAKEAREVHDLMALREFAGQSGLPRERIPEEIDGYHVLGMTVQLHVYGDDNKKIAIDPVVKVNRYYSERDLFDDDGDVAGPFDARRTRLEEHNLRSLPDGDLLAVYLAASNDISTAVSVGLSTFQDYELEQTRVVAAEIRRRRLA